MEQILNHKETIRCETTNNEFSLKWVVPDMMMEDLQRLLISKEQVIVDETKKLGEGSFATVFKGTFENQEVAVKVLKMDTQEMIADENHFKEFQREVNVMG